MAGETTPAMVTDLARKAGGDAFATIKRTAELADDPTMAMAVLVIAVASMAATVKLVCAPAPDLLELWNVTYAEFQSANADDAANALGAL